MKIENDKMIKVNEFDMLIADNTEWEYNRVGLYKNKFWTYVLDVDDDNVNGVDNKYRALAFSKKSIDEVIDIGKLCNVFVKEGDEVYYNFDVSNEDCEKFYEMI